MSDIPLPEYLTTRQLAELAGITRSQVNSLIRQGRITPAPLPGEQWLIPRVEADRWLRSRIDDSGQRTVGG